ncbi:hypothetical protein THERU_02000 [Thermocrinis ruber]|uniref:Uncharacterized protein n=1 Tax=Thermocrinis ruber TaxID=75906 RepID=W0DIS7_9AQUI|nr:hypothetical protein THERU_02000 [Thermocrinis ruber]
MSRQWVLFLPQGEDQSIFVFLGFPLFFCLPVWTNSLKEGVSLSAEPSLDGLPLLHVRFLKLKSCRPQIFPFFLTIS